jgi:hypothetical protein
MSPVQTKVIHRPNVFFCLAWRVFPSLVQAGMSSGWAESPLDAFHKVRRGGTHTKALFLVKISFAGGYLLLWDSTDASE